MDQSPTDYTKKPLLLIGGSGVVGSLVAKQIRKFHPTLPIMIGGRNKEKAVNAAKEIDLATGTKIDLTRTDLGLSDKDDLSGIVMLVKDLSLHSLRYAQSKGIAYINISSGVLELSPEIALYAHQPSSAPILLNSFWLAGTILLPTLYFSKEFAVIDEIAIGALLDEEDMGGPAAYADYERQSKAGPYALILKNGSWIWATDKDQYRTFSRVDGTSVKGEAYSIPLDVSSLAAATSAPSIRLDLAIGVSSSRHRGEHFSLETIIEITGKKKDGTVGSFRYELIHPEGQAPLTAMGVIVSVEHLLGLAGNKPAASGLYFPETLIRPEHMIERLKEIGTEIRQTG